MSTQLLDAGLVPGMAASWSLLARLLARLLTLLCVGLPAHSTAVEL